MKLTFTINLGPIASVLLLLAAAWRAWCRRWLAIRTWGLSPWRADYDHHLKAALRRADLEKNHGRQA